MATRTIKFMGKAYSTTGDVSLVVNFNSVEVFSGTVNTVNSEVPEDAPESEQLFTFSLSTDTTGSIPLSVECTGGTLLFNNLLGNYTGYELQADEAGALVVVDDAYVVETSPSDYYSDLNVNTPESDGKNNVSISPDEGSGQVRDPADSQWSEAQLLGDWTYRVWNGSTLTCNYVVDPVKTVTTVPTP
jgi:hypothetical protein